MFTLGPVSVYEQPATTLFGGMSNYYWGFAGTNDICGPFVSVVEAARNAEAMVYAASAPKVPEKVGQVIAVDFRMKRRVEL